MKPANNSCAFRTLGCKVNWTETESLRRDCRAAGWTEAPLETATLLIVNTCAVTRTSEGKSRRLILRLIRQHPDSRLIVTGCYASHNPEAIRRIIRPGRDIIVPQEAKPQITQIINTLFKGSRVQRFKGSTVQELKGSKTTLKPLNLGTFEPGGRDRAFLKVQDGCNYGCAYCVIPLIRGRSKSRPMDEVLSEAQELLDDGHREIVLTGINLGQYGRDFTPQTRLNDAVGQADLIGLINALVAEERLYRLRLSSIEVTEITDKLINLAAHPVRDKLCPHFHIPLQSGSDKILRAMGRRYLSADYLKVISGIRAAIADPAITTDVITGFPSETEADFQETLRVCAGAAFSKIHIFPYSPRPGTRSAGLSDPVPPATAKERSGRLNQLAISLADQYRRRFIGKTVQILLEGKDDQTGLTERYLKVRLKKPQKALVNHLIPVRVQRVTPEGLEGSPL